MVRNLAEQMGRKMEQYSMEHLKEPMLKERLMDRRLRAELMG